jgi:protoheme IX farnesyltransferase
VIGGAAGAFPPLIGWVAATGRIELLPVLLFATIFLWTPPHFWALSLFVRSDYAAAGVPMLPVTHGKEATRRQIAQYSLPLAAAAIAPWPIGQTGPVYGVASVGLNAVFLVMSLQVLANRAGESSGMGPEKRLFGFSVLYLFALFAALVADRWIVL